jgi:glycosyltransferase involved in cell wall biosynthesis
MKLLIDLRSINYGRSGGIENYAYYVIECLKNTGIEIILDVSPYSKSFYKKKYQSDKNITIICDPLLEKLNKLIQTFFPDKFRALGSRKNWAKKAIADFVYCPNHLPRYQHLHLPGIITIHAYLTDDNAKIKENIKYNADAAKALITSWNYPYQEFIRTFPQHKHKWHLIPYIAAHNIDIDKQIPVNNLPVKYLLYVSFFSERKNHLNLVKAYAKALKRNLDIPKLVLVGGGKNDYKQKVKETMQELNLLNDVFVFDYLPDEQISYLYHNCYAVIAPTLWEAASGCVLEATHCGKPVLCSNVPPLVDFANYFELDMMFFDPLDIADISDKIVNFCNDYETVKNWGRANENKIKKYDRNYFAKSFMSILNK